MPATASDEVTVMADVFPSIELSLAMALNATHAPDLFRDRQAQSWHIRCVNADGFGVDRYLAAAESIREVSARWSTKYNTLTRLQSRVKEGEIKL